MEQPEYGKPNHLRSAAIAVFVSVATIFLIALLSKGVRTYKEINRFSFNEIITYSLMFSAVFAIDSVRTVVLSHFLNDPFPFFKALENSILGYFFSYVTPFSAGGQPFQIYHLTRSGMKSENASAIILTRWSNMLIFLSLSALFFALRDLTLIKTGIPLLDKIVWIIIGGSIAVSGVIVFSLLFPKVGNVVVRTLKKLKLGKPYEKIFKRKFATDVERFSRWLDKFYSSIRMIWIKRPALVLFDMIMGISDLGIIFYVLYRAISYSSKLLHTEFGLSFFGLSIIFILLSYIVYYIPTPGASGGVEGGFFAVLSHYGNRFAVMRGILVWRISTYYFTIAIGLILLAIVYKKGRV